MTFTQQLSTSVAAVALATLAALPAQAASEAEITEALRKAITAEAGTTVDLGAPAEDGNALVYSNVTINGGGDTPSTTTIGTLTLTGADLNAEGGIVAEAMSAESIRTVGDGSTATVESIEVTNPDFPPPGAGDEGPAGVFDELTATGLTFSEGEKSMATIETITVTTSEHVDRIPHAISFAVEGVTFDPANLEDGAEAAAQLAALGYDTLNVSAYGSGNWDADAGTLTFEELSVEGVDAGSLTVALTLGGVTREVMTKLQSSNPSPDAMSSVTLQDASIVYIDESLAGRVLEMQAKQMGTTREAFAEQMSAALPLMLSALQNPPFQQKVAAAVGSFLKDPQNLTITAEPAQPVPLMQVMMEGQMSPQTLPDTLNVGIEANQPLEQ